MNDPRRDDRPTPNAPLADEASAIRDRYAARATKVDADRYSVFNAAAREAMLERQSALIQLLDAAGRRDLASMRIVDLGCGSGGALSDFIRWGATPSLLTGLELLPARAAQARERLPSAVTIHHGDALAAPIAAGSVDLVSQFVVFSSLLDDAYQQRLADAMWGWLKPGGAIVWYDFVVDNPRNTHVRGVSLARAKALFPQARVMARRVTLAPPLARHLPRPLRVLLGALPWLRTHRLALLIKP